MAIALRNWLATMDGLLQSTVVCPRAHIRIDGTRWSEMDIYAYLIENDVKNLYAKVIYGVETDKNGRFTSSVPGFTHEVLQLVRDKPTMSASLWAANFRNSPIIGEGAMQFLPEWFKPYEKVPDYLSIAITVDPAWSEQEKNPDADRSAIVVSGVCPDGNLYVLATRAGRWSPSELLDNLYALIGTWDPLWVGIEGGTQSVTLIEVFTNELHRSFPFVPFRTLKTKGQKKLLRAVPLHTHAQRHGIFVRPGEHDELVQEHLTFPGGRYKDYVDALAYRAQDLVLPGMRLALGEKPLNNPRNLPTGNEVLGFVNIATRQRDALPWETFSSRN